MEEMKDILSEFKKLYKPKEKDDSQVEEWPTSQDLPLDFDKKVAWLFNVASEKILIGKFLNTLYFPSLRQRRSHIEAAHERTFEWLLQDSQKRKSLSDPKLRFQNWLQSGSGIFWVSGKPGSGKSTLMKYVAGHSRTVRELHKWANSDNITGGALTTSKPISGDNPGQGLTDQDSESRERHPSERKRAVRVVTASFYFWSAGTTMQKSQKGLFQSLLYEVFSNAPDLIRKAAPRRWEAIETGAHIEPWSLEEISDTIMHTISLESDSVKFCFFIDGVDEYSGDHTDIVRILKNMAQFPNIKLCLSSRPWNIFEDAFGKDEELKFYLQDLTLGDINRYVRSKLEQHRVWREQGHGNQHYKVLAGEIVKRAQGVFLWVFLVVRSLLEGLTNDDSLPLLQARLRQIPTDLRQFFRYILDSLDPLYNQRVAHFFLAALESPEPLRLIMYAYFDQEHDNPSYIYELDSKPMDTYESLTLHKQAERRINGRCKGLLEVYRYPDSDEALPYRVEFLHRTVRDYFMTYEMREEFESKMSPTVKTCTSNMKAAIAALKKMPKYGPPPGKCPIVSELLEFGLQSAKRAELINEVPSTRILDEMSHTLGSIGFFDSIYHNRPGNHDDRFLSLVVARGLELYSCQQLQYRFTGQRPVLLQLSEKGYPILACALGLIKNPWSEEPDVSDLVIYLLRKGCDPNEDFDGVTPFSRLLQFMGHEKREEMTTLPATIYSNRLRLLKSLLAHGANPNYDPHNEGGAIWARLLNKLYTSHYTTRTIAEHYIEVIKVLLSNGADPNLRCSIPTCGRCPIDFTPWRHFIKWLSSLDRSRIPFHRIEFIAQLCRLMIEHGVDTSLRTPLESGWNGSNSIDGGQLKSVEEIIVHAFPASIYPQVLAQLPQYGSKDATLGKPYTSKPLQATEVNKSSDPLTATTSFWNPLAWWS
jgi:hypothetical protein